jgi:hypothetical protein
MPGADLSRLHVSLRSSRLSSVAVQSLPDQLAQSERHSAFCRHLDLLQGPRVLGHPGWRCLRFENAEVTELQAVSLGEFTDDLVEEMLDYALDERLSRAGTCGDAVNQVLLGRCDQSPPGRAAAQLESREQSSQSTAETSKNKEFVLRRRCQVTVSRLSGKCQTTRPFWAWGPLSQTLEPPCARRGSPLSLKAVRDA